MRIIFLILSYVFTILFSIIVWEILLPAKIKTPVANFLIALRAFFIKKFGKKA